MTAGDAELNKKEQETLDGHSGIPCEHLLKQLVCSQSSVMLQSYCTIQVLVSVCTQDVKEACGLGQ